MALTGLPNPVLPARRHFSRPWIFAGVAVLAGIMTGIWFAGQNWPFRYGNVKSLLEDTFGCQISIASFHRTYMPYAGFVATGVTLRRRTAPHQAPIGTIREIMVRSSWWDVLRFRRRVQLFRMDQFHLVLPPPGTQAAKEDFPPGSTVDFNGPETPVDVFEVRNSTLDILRQGDDRFSFPVHDLRVENLESGQPWAYTLDMENAIPSGHIRSSGVFGPLNAHQPGATPVRGQFQFDLVQLKDVGRIHGVLSSKGNFSGRLDALTVHADAYTPDFSVTDGKPTAVEGHVDAIVSGLNGDVALQTINLQTGHTTILVSGAVQGAPHKATHLEASVRNGRAEDLLRPFMHGPVPIAGPVRLHARIYLAPSGTGSFFHRLQVDGAFDVPSDRATDAATERKLSVFSLRAQGKKTPDDDDKTAPVPDAISSLEGPASIRDEIVTTRQLAFKVGGAQAELQGSYNLHTDVVHLTGNLRMEADISHTAKGVKSFLLKPLAPFFRRKHAGAVVPIAVTGGPGSYKVTEDLSHSK